jgi:aromatase
MIRAAIGETELAADPATLGDRPLEELGLDSLALMELLSAVKQRWDTHIPDDDVDITMTAAALAALIDARISRREPTFAAGHTDNAIVIHAPQAVVWRLTNDVRNWPSLFTEYAAIEVLEERDDYVRFRLTTKPDENDQVWSWVSERMLRRDRGQVEARRVETGPFEYMRIRWDYRPVSEGVEMRWRQDFRMKPTAPLDDAGMTARINANTVREMRRIKDLIEAREAGAAAS